MAFSRPPVVVVLQVIVSLVAVEAMAVAAAQDIMVAAAELHGRLQVLHCLQEVHKPLEVQEEPQLMQQQRLVITEVTGR